MANLLLTDLTNLSASLTTYIAASNADGNLGKIDINTLKSIIGVAANLALGTATTATNPGTAVGNRMWITTGPGTYTAFAGITIATDEVAFLVDTGTTYVKATIPITLSGYVATSSIVDNTSTTDSSKVLSAAQGAALGAIVANTPILDVANGGGTTVQATMAHARAMWFVGKSAKSFNVITIPIVRNFTGGASFTNGIVAKIWKNGTLLYTRTITLTELAPYNALTSSNVAADFDFQILLPFYVNIVVSDVICIGWEPIATGDQVGYVINTIATDSTTEYGGNYVMGSNTYGYVINNTLTPNTLPSSQTYRYRVILKKYDLNLPGLQSDLTAANFLYPTAPKLDGYAVESDVISWETIGKIAIKAYALGVRGVVRKVFNAVSFPIVKNYLNSLNFTGDIRAKVWLNQTLIKDVTIPFSVVDTYNSLLQTDSAYKFDYTIALDKTYVLGIGDLVTFGVTVVNSADSFNPFYYTVTPSTASEISENLRVTSTDPNFIINATTPPTLSSLSYRFRVNLLMVDSVQSRIGTSFLWPKRVYSVANNILYDKTGDINTYNGLSRNYVASLYLDHVIRTLPREVDAHFKSTKQEYHEFISPIDHNGTTMFFNNTSNVPVLQQTVPVQVEGDDVTGVSATIKHISVLASIGKTTTPRILCIGDSLTFGQGAWFADNKLGANQVIQNYPLLLKKLYNMDWGDAGFTAGQYQINVLGHNVRSMSYTYNGTTSTIAAGHEGIPGATVNYYLTNSATPFWDTTSASFKLAAWLTKYRTMDNSGVRLSNSDPSKGTLVTDTSAYDVTIPTHIVLFMGANDNAGSASSNAYWADINTMIAAIKAEYTANSWGTPKIAVCLPDTAFTFFQSKYWAMYGDRVSFWAETLPSSDQRHDKLWTFAQQWAALDDTAEETNNVWFVPTFWLMPTAQAVQVRRLGRTDVGGDPNSTSIPGNPTIPDRYIPFGASPRTHVNPNAHFAWAYQIYGWLKYTLSL